MKILVLRFSSIGDIVLTTPVIRTLKKQLPGCEIHYCTKEKFSSLVEPNPYIDKVLLLGESFSELLDRIHLEKYDFIVDLHNNLRTLQIKLLKLTTRGRSFRKLNIQKFLTVHTPFNFLPSGHIVDRYLKTVESLGVKNDNQGLDFFFPEGTELPDAVNNLLPTEPFLLFVAGGTYYTKRLPPHQIRKLLTMYAMPVVIIGDRNDRDAIEESLNGLEKPVLNLCGKLSLSLSARVMQKCSVVVSHDTGFMHIAAALRKPLISVWGNTIPEFGMTPYYPETIDRDFSVIAEVKGLKCRPCSKLGYNACPKKHFNCMENQNLAQIIAESERLMTLAAR